ncbi:MAG: alpha/beta fold hydrolase [Phenylobacterium sp.]|uniref:alpha/beta fold hydrolase n=1 Tax=Phenylobacterium sp. TaxID=1871053 RepID=UPI001A4DEF1E|nr:alpha/beta fold hydrolase [Phenylobacterium sp.]MBL8770566.1 alpha/beta fold hydrolase [Phenylobacterium sp.]
MTAIWKTPAGGEAVRTRYREFLTHWPVPHEHLRIPTSQGETFVVASGPSDAPAVLLLHGSVSNAASWMGDVVHLAQRFRVYAVDMIGEPGLSAESRPTLASGVYAGWLGEVMSGLGVERAALVGISLGGWLALQFATANSGQVTALALLCPGGVGRHKNVLIWALPLLMLGPWGRRKATEKILGPAPPGDPSPEAVAFGEFMQLIFANFRPRTEALPPFDDAALARLAMPVQVILGAKDAMIDSAGTRDRLQRLAPQTEVIWLPDAGHMLINHGAGIERFLRKAVGS